MVTVASSSGMWTSGTSACATTGSSFSSGGDGLVAEASAVEAGVRVGEGEEAAVSGASSGNWLRMMSRCAVYHAFTLSSIMSGFAAMRNAQSVFLFFAVVVILSKSISTL